jgi:hypothetical protein
MQVTMGMDLGIVMAMGVVLGVPPWYCCCTPSCCRWTAPSGNSAIRLQDQLEKLNAFVSGTGISSGAFMVLFLPLSLPTTHAGLLKLDKSLPQDMPSIVATGQAQG